MTRCRSGFCEEREASGWCGLSGTSKPLIIALLVAGKFVSRSSSLENVSQTCLWRAWVGFQLVETWL
jgi:hypothetical protein